MKQSSLNDWRDQGEYIDVNGNKIFNISAGEAKLSGNGVLVVHGFPGSSWDWSGVVAEVSKHTRIVVPDMLGFGQSDKPQDGTFEEHYSLFKQADLYEAVAKQAGLTEVMLVAHDMGQTVAAELMKRQQEGVLSFKIRHAVLFNGSTLINLVELIDLQKRMLAAPDTLGPDLEKSMIMKELNDSFVPRLLDDSETLDIMATQIIHNHGDRIFARQIRYMKERERNLQRWTAGVVNFDAPVTLCWGTRDPVSVELMADAWKELQPMIELHKWQDVSHWPSIEVPERVAQIILGRYWHY